MWNRVQNEFDEPAGGYSLIELTAALCVLSVGLLGTIQAYHFGLDKMRTIREVSVASRAVQDQIEALRSQPFSALADQDHGRFADLGADFAGLVNVTPTLTIRPYADPALRLKEVTASVRWTGDSGRTMERSVTTLIVDKSPAAPRGAKKERGTS